MPQIYNYEGLEGEIEASKYKRGLWKESDEKIPPIYSTTLIPSWAIYYLLQSLQDTLTAVGNFEKHLQGKVAILSINFVKLVTHKRIREKNKNS